MTNIIRWPTVVDQHEASFDEPPPWQLGVIDRLSAPYVEPEIAVANAPLFPRITATLGWVMVVWVAVCCVALAYGVLG